mmetsp:Transcript_60128/g.131728  ORF Transcript_60128/g.131728 Transcript_60128/m.131728 type:complete len:242 (+) Transcript_60128:287-1012(+)
MPLHLQKLGLVLATSIAVVRAVAVTREEQVQHGSSMMRREADSSSSEGKAAAHWAPTAVTSSNVIDLNGDWTASASGENRVIADNVATGPNSFKVDLYIKQGGRRVEFQSGNKSYWATLTGRGALNWNDGNMWTRKVDCKWSDWTDFGACGGPCAAGEQQRQREYEYLQENGGKPCVGELLRCQESAYCNTAVVETTAHNHSADEHSSTEHSSTDGHSSTEHSTTDEHSSTEEHSSEHSSH